MSLFASAVWSPNHTQYGKNPAPAVLVQLAWLSVAVGYITFLSEESVSIWQGNREVSPFIMHNLVFAPDGSSWCVLLRACPFCVCLSDACERLPLLLLWGIVVWLALTSMLPTGYGLNRWFPFFLLILLMDSALARHGRLRTVLLFYLRCRSAIRFSHFF
jgi:hypothetical protein